MKLVAIMPCRNSAWALRLTVNALMLWVDELIMLDHASTDGTLAIMDELSHEFPDRIGLCMESDPIWAEMSHRQRLLSAARKNGATHIVTIDDDELITGNLVEHIRGLYERLQPHRVLTIPWLCMRGSHDQVQVGDGVWGCQDVSVGFIDAPELHWKARNGYDFHHRHPMGMPYDAYRPIGAARRYGLMHLQFSSERRLRAKQALYKMIEVIRWPDRSSVAAVNRMYDLAVYGSYDSLRPDQKTEQAMPEWWATYAERGWMGMLDLDAEPWQEAECRRLWAEHGPLKFDGLDLFGVV